MKRSVLIIAVIILSFAAKAQEDNIKEPEEEIQTLFGGQTRISGFGGPLMSFTTVSGNFAHMMGGGGAVLLGDFFLGGYGEGLTTALDAAGEDITFGHGGFWTGYSFMAKKPIHPAISAQIGWGSITPSYNSSSSDNPVDNVFVVNPAIEMEMNFTRFFRLSLGAHYRIVQGVDNTPPLSNSDFSGPGAYLVFKFGWF